MDGRLGDRSYLSSRYATFVGFTFAAVVANSFGTYSDVLFDPLGRPTAFLALVNLYVLVLLSWAGYSQSLAAYPYSDEFYSFLRLVADFLVVVVYFYLLRTVAQFGSGSIVWEFVLGYFLVFTLYIVSGRLRMREYARAASKQGLLFAVWALYGASVALYYLADVARETGLWSGLLAPGPVNSGLVTLTAVVYVGWRVIRDIGGERRERSVPDTWWELRRSVAEYGLLPSLFRPDDTDDSDGDSGESAETDDPTRMFVLSGLPGVGKSFVGESIAAATGATHLATDEIRKDLFPSPNYTAAETRETYAELFRRAWAHLDEGGDVVLDGTFSRDSYRDYADRVAGYTGAERHLLKVECDPAVVRERIADRDGVSDADFRVHVRKDMSFDPVDRPHETVDNSGTRAETRSRLADRYPFVEFE